MKTHKNRKYYNFTPRQRQRDRTPKHFYNATAKYRRPYVKQWRAECRHIMNQIRAIVTPEVHQYWWYVQHYLDIDYEFPRARHSANWDYN